MKKIKKYLNLKITLLSIVGIFLFNSAVYGIDFYKTYLRIPLISSIKQGRKRLENTKTNEVSTIMDVEYQSLKSAVDRASLEDGEIISYKGFDHYILFCDTDDGLPAEYKHPSSLVDGGDIYIYGLQ